MTPLFWAIALFILSLLLIGLEAFIPSAGVLGILAGIILLYSIYLGFTVSLLTGFCMVASAVIAIPLMFLMFVKWWPLTPLGKRMLIDTPEDADELLPDGESYRQTRSQIGKKGTAITDLLPNGRITIEGLEFDAVTEGVLVNEGTTIEVTEVEGNRIIVRPLSSSPQVISDSVVEQPRRSADLSQPADDSEVDPFDDPLA